MIEGDGFRYIYRYGEALYHESFIDRMGSRVVSWRWIERLAEWEHGRLLVGLALRRQRGRFEDGHRCSFGGIHWMASLIEQTYDHIEGYLGGVWWEQKGGRYHRLSNR